MHKLILLTIALALTPTIYAKEEDRDKYVYYCDGGNQLFACAPNLKEGDPINRIYPFQAVLYCDKDELILDAMAEEGMPTYNCIYNGRTIKETSHHSVYFDRMK